MTLFKMWGISLIVGVLWASWVGVDGHGRLVDPPARGTMWRLGFDTPVNYNDHQLFCGGYDRQWIENRGRCGECGDPWDMPRPRPNEGGGIFGTGTISKVYHQGQVLAVTVHLTANHMGWFEFRLCANDNPGQYVKQSCLNKHVLRLVDYPGTRYKIKHSKTGLFRVRLQLPETVTCSQCVLQWHYTTGNNWGFCKDGSNQPGCGPQEVFRGCSDVAIFSLDDPTYYLFSNLTREADLSHFLHLEERPVNEPTRTEPKQPVDLGLIFDGEEHFSEDDPTEGDVPARGTNDLLKAGEAPKQPSLSFVQETKVGGSGFRRRHRLPTSPKSSSSFEDLLRRPDYFRDVPKKYVSSDVFRKTPRPALRLVEEEEEPRFLSAPTPFFPAPSRRLVLHPDVQGVTASPLGPPLALPRPRSTVAPEFHFATSLGATVDATGGGRLTETQETLPILQDITPTVLQLFQSFPGLASGGITNSPVAFQLPLSSLQDDTSVDRLMMLQKALSITSPSVSQADSPIVLILM